jgi:GAF domain-containing protein
LLSEFKNPLPWKGKVINMKRDGDISQEGLESLQTFAKAVSNGLDLETILERTADKIYEFMDVKNLAFFFYEEATDTLNLRIHRGVHRDLVEKISKIRMGEGLTGDAAQQKKIMARDSAKGDPRSLQGIGEEGNKLTSCSIPLLSRDKLYGVLSLEYHSFHYLTAQELQILETIGNLISQAIENTLLFEKVVKYSSELEKRVEAKSQELLSKNEDLKQAYEDLQMMQDRLVKASRLAVIGEMSLTVQHDINNPLTAILGEAQLMLMGKNLSEEMRKSLKTIEQLSIRLQEVVRKLSEVNEDKTKEFMKGI